MNQLKNVDYRNKTWKPINKSIKVEEFERSNSMERTEV